MTTPETCNIEPFRYQATPQAVGEQGASASQINEQFLEDWLNRFREAVCADLQAGGSGGATSFLQLTDTPSSYIGAALRGVRVNAAANALEFFLRTFLSLTDVPASYAGAGGKVVAVNGGESALEFVDGTTASDVYGIATTHREILSWIPVSTTPFIASRGSVGTLSLEAGTGSYQVPSTGSVISSRQRARYVTGAGSTNLNIGIRSTVFPVRLGSSAGQGGFRMRFRFGTETALGVQRVFCGLAGNVSWGGAGITTRTDLIGLGYTQATDTNMQILHNDAAGAPTSVDLGALFPIDAVSIYDVLLVAAPNAASVTYKVTRVNDGSIATGTLSTNLPAGDTNLTPYLWGVNGSLAVLQVVFFNLILEQYS